MESTKVIAIAGIIGTLAGTVVGAGIAAWTDSRIENRRERREEKADAKRARAAARMLRVDLVVSAAAINGVIKDGMWDPARMYLTLENWRIHGEHLALALEDGAAWNRVELAMTDALERLSAMRKNVEPAPLTPSAKERLRSVHATLMEAGRTLAPLAGDPEAQSATEAAKQASSLVRAHSVHTALRIVL